MLPEALEDLWHTMLVTRLRRWHHPETCEICSLDDRVSERIAKPRQEPAKSGDQVKVAEFARRGPAKPKTRDGASRGARKRAPKKKTQ